MVFCNNFKELIVRLATFHREERPFHGILLSLHQNIINYSVTANLNRIKVVLVEKSKTGKWLAEELGKTPCTVSKWCSNSIQPDLQTLDKIAKLLGVDVKELLNPTEEL